MTRNPRSLAVLAIASLWAAGCSGSSSSAGEPSDAESPQSSTPSASIVADEAPPEAEQDSSADQPDVADADEAARPSGWTIQVGMESYQSDADRTICLPVPGGSFVLNGAGTHATEGEFQLFVSNEGGGEMSFQTASSGGFVIVTDDGDDVEVKYTDTDGLVVALGTNAEGVVFSVVGVCR